METTHTFLNDFSTESGGFAAFSNPENTQTSTFD